MFNLDFGDLSALAKDFDAAPKRLVAKTETVVTESGIDLQNSWRSNAQESAGTHGRFYPKRIRSRRAGVLAVDVGPTPGKQGDMAFEFGSRNQPPHLDGQRALDIEAPRISRRIEIVASDVLG